MSRYEDDRIYYDRERGPRGRENERFYEDDRVYMSGGRGRDSPDRGYDRRPPPPPRAYDDEFVRDRRFYEDDRFERRPGGVEFDRRVIYDREREREYQQELPRRPVMVRRQSSLDSYDRRPLRGFEPREEYPPPARREDVRRDDFRAPTYAPIPLPRMEGIPPPRSEGMRSDGMPPPRRGEHERDFHDDERVIDRDYYINDGKRFPDHVHEREVIRTHDERDRSRESHARTARSSKHSPPSSRGSSSSRTRSHAGTVKSEYPKRGKTKIPARLVETRAIIDLEYPFVVEGNSIIILKALGQDHIDEVLRLSEEYRKSESARGLTMPKQSMSRTTANVCAAEVIVDGGKKEEVVKETIKEEIITKSAPQPTVVIAPPEPAPLIIDAHPHGDEIVDITEETIIRTDPHRHHRHHSHGNELVIRRPSRSRSRSKSGREIRSEIRALERELVHRPRYVDDEYDIVRTERMEDGQLVVYEERVERVHSHKPTRIEKDKKGRISISVPAR